MSVQDTAPAAPARPSCPRWCAGDHTGDYVESHRIEVGRVAEGELALVVAILHPIGSEDAPVLELSWEGTDPSDDGHYLLEAIEMYATEVAPLAELIGHAGTMLTRIGERP